MQMTSELRAISANILVELALERGATWNQLAGDLPSSCRRLREPDLFGSQANYTALVDAVARMFDGTDIGIQWGHRSGISALSVLGLALVSASTTEELLRLWTRYKNLLPEGQHITHTIDCGTITLHRTTPSPKHLTRTARLLTERHLAWCATNMRTLTAGLGRATVCRVPWSAPPYADQYNTIADQTSFRAQELELVFPQSHLDLPLVCGGSASMVDHFKSILDQAMAQQATQRHISAKNTVMGAIERADGTFRSLESVASVLGVSPRTVRRMLNVEGTNYRDMIREVKMKRAEHLLADTPLSIEQISEASGFDNPQSFRQAFRQWRRMSPREWRNQQTEIEAASPPGDETCSRGASEPPSTGSSG